MSKSDDSGDRTVAGCGMHMQSIVTIDETGTINLKTHTFTHCKMKGFTGGTKAIFSDAAGTVLYQTPTESYGVDGEMIPFSRSSRWDEKTYHVDPSVYTNTDRIDVLVFPNPHNRLIEDVEKIFDLTGKVIEWAIYNFGSGQEDSSSADQTDPSTESGDYTINMGDGNYAYGVYKQKLSPSLATPVPLSPINNEQTCLTIDAASNQVIARTTLKWQQVPGATGYRVFMDCLQPGQPFYSIIGWNRIYEGDTEKTEITIDGMMAVQSRWCVRAIDNNGKCSFSPDSDWAYFICVRPPPLATPVPLSPINNEQTCLTIDVASNQVVARTTLKWQPVPGATGYKVFMDFLPPGQPFDPTIGWYRIYEGDTEKTEVTIDGMVAAQSRWCVRAIDNNEKRSSSPDSDWAYFICVRPPETS